MAVLLDTGPWVALLSRNDTHHKWAVEQFRLLSPPLLSCEAVVAETCFLLKRSGFDPSLALQFVERGVGTYQRCCPLEMPALSTFSHLTAFCFSWATS